MTVRNKENKRYFHYCYSETDISLSQMKVGPESSGEGKETL